MFDTGLIIVVFFFFSYITCHGIIPLQYYEKDKTRFVKIGTSRHSLTKRYVTLRRQLQCKLDRRYFYKKFTVFSIDSSVKIVRVQLLKMACFLIKQSARTSSK